MDRSPVEQTSCTTVPLQFTVFVIPKEETWRVIVGLWKFNVGQATLQWFRCHARLSHGSSLIVPAAPIYGSIVSGLEPGGFYPGHRAGRTCNTGRDDREGEEQRLTIVRSCPGKMTPPAGVYM